MKEFFVFGIGNGIVDVFLRVSEEEFSPLGFSKGTMELVPAAVQSELIERFSERHSGLMSGGSVANSLILFSQLGGRAAFSTSISDDPFGEHYAREFQDLGITLARPQHRGRTTGTSLIFVTPDSERTMRTNLGVSADMGLADLDPAIAARSEFTFLEGYLFLGDEGFAREIPKYAQRIKANGSKVALTLSDRFVVELKGELIEKTLASVDLLFANEHEACALTGAANGPAAFEKLRADIPFVALTMGAEGAIIGSSSEATVRIPAFPTETADLTGAGDAFAGALLYALSANLPLPKAGRHACWMASQVIAQVGARLSGDVRGVFDSMTNS
jgi:sugar/nucleoside kinase (ribokinase family)